ncbi:MAG TPA: hypothetical protein VII94_00815 [Candidatus Saccharimonadales bacterium]
MLYNTTHKLTKIIDPPSHEDIYNCPHYFGMSYDQVKSSGAPDFLIKLLDQFPFDGRKNILQIRPQDFRVGNAPIDGRHWHTDYNVRLLDNGAQKKIYANDHDDFHLMVISWGAGCSTEFIETPMDLPNNLELKESQEKWDLWDKSLADRLAQPFKVISAPKNQMMEYTARDLHRADGIMHSNGLRLMIVAFDCSDIEGKVRVLPSIKELDNGAEKPVYSR